MGCVVGLFVCEGCVGRWGSVCGIVCVCVRGYWSRGGEVCWCVCGGEEVSSWVGVVIVSDYCVCTLDVAHMLSQYLFNFL